MTYGFVANAGHLPANVRYATFINDGTVHLYADGLQLHLPTVEHPRHDSYQHENAPVIPKRGAPHDVRLQFLNSNPQPQLSVTHRLTATLSDYSHQNQALWRENLSQYATVRYHNLYPAISLDYSLTADQSVKSTYVVAPQGDPSQIRWQYQGVQNLSIAPTGELVLTLPPRQGFAQRTITETAPLAWQDSAGDRVFVPVQFALNNRQVSFSIGTYDPNLPLVIDPTLTVTRRFGINLYDPQVIPYPDGTWYVTGSSDTAVPLIHLASDQTTVLNTTILLSQEGRGRVAVTAQGLIAVSLTDVNLALLVMKTSPSSAPLVYGLPHTNQYPDVYDLKAHPSLNQVSLLLHDYEYNLSSPRWLITANVNGILTTQSLNSATNYTQLAFAPNGSLYAQWNTRDANRNNTWAISRWTGTGWQAIWQSSYHAYNQVGVGIDTFTLDRDGRIVILTTTMLPDVLGSSYRGARLGVVLVAPSGTVMMQRALSGETIVDDTYGNSTHATMVIPLLEGGILVTGGTNGQVFPNPGPAFGLTRGFVMQLAADTSIVLNAVYGDTPNETYFSSLAYQPSGAVLIGGSTRIWVESSGGEIVQKSTGFLAHMRMESQFDNPRSGAPRYTNSYYEYTKDPQVFYNQGCRSRHNKEQGIVFLFFGGVKATGASGYGEEPTYAEIKTLIRYFVRGYITGKNCYGNGTNIPITTKADLTLAVSTSNSYLYCTQTNEDNICIAAEGNPDLTFSNGQQWSQMVTQLSNEIKQNYDGVTIVGGFDAEPNWDRVATNAGSTTPWIEGYGSVSATTLRPLYIFGSCDGCARIGYPTQALAADKEAAMQLPFRWNFYYSYTRSVPQIYNFLYAQEWYQLRKYALDAEINRQIQGTMTQCGHSHCSEPPYTNPNWENYPVPCEDPVEDFEPHAGWFALSDKLNYTLLNPLTLNSPLQLRRPYQPGSGLTVSVPNEGEHSLCNPIPARLLPASTTFQKGNPFAYQSNPRPDYTVETQQGLRWSTDIYGNELFPNALPKVRP